MNFKWSFVGYRTFTLCISHQFRNPLVTFQSLGSHLVQLGQSKLNQCRFDSVVVYIYLFVVYDGEVLSGWWSTGHWMVKYWTLDGEVLAPGWVNSGPEMLLEKLGTVLEKNKTNGWFCRQNCSLSEVLSFWWNPFFIYQFFVCFDGVP